MSTPLQAAKQRAGMGATCEDGKVPDQQRALCTEGMLNILFTVSLALPAPLPLYI